MTRPTHPLKAWRETQTVIDAKTKKPRAMTIADAARLLGVPYQTWMGWEHYSDDPKSRIPDKVNMKRILQLTNLQVRPDHFYDIPQLRAARSAPPAADGQEAAA